MRRPKSPQIGQAGFTIVELMVATLVFSVVLIVIAVGVMHFTNDYYRGINSSTTQTTAQNITDTISQAIQFSDGGTVATTTGGSVFCAGDKLFMYSQGKELTGAPTSSNWGLYMVSNPSPGTCTALTGSPSGGTELLGKSLRLSNISVSNAAPTDPTSPWQIVVSVVYGDSDLLCRKSITGTTTGGCQSGAASYAATATVSGDDVTCKIQSGSQFCYVANLSTVAQERIVN